MKRTILALAIGVCAIATACADRHEDRRLTTRYFLVTPQLQLARPCQDRGAAAFLAYIRAFGITADRFDRKIAALYAQHPHAIDGCTSTLHGSNFVKQTDQR